MSGYLEVKLTLRANRGFTPWKAWKKQWCILRPSPVKEDFVIIVFHTSAGMASNSQVEIPQQSILCRTDSKTKKYSFGVFTSPDCRKPLLLMAGQSESESQMWMHRIRMMLARKNPSEKLTLQRNYFNVSVIDNDFANLCGFKSLYGVLALTSDGFQIMDDSSHQPKESFLWDHISHTFLSPADRVIDDDRIVTITFNSKFRFGAGYLYVFCQAGKSLVKVLQNRVFCFSPEMKRHKLNRRKSRSEGTLFHMSNTRYQINTNLRDSGLSSCGPASSENGSKWDCTSQDSNIRLSMDDNGYVLKGKVAETLISAGIMLSAPRYQKSLRRSSDEEEDFLTPLVSLPDAPCPTSSIDRRSSGVSIASGIYEEISEQIIESSKKSNHNESVIMDNTYEALPESKVGPTRRFSKRLVPPPLPPKNRINSGRLDSASDSGLEEESLCSTPLQEPGDVKWTSIHGSLGSLPINCFGNIQHEEDDMAHPYDSDAFSKSSFNHSDKFTSEAFRNRMKSDSQASKGCDSLSVYSNNSMNRKKRFDLSATPTKSMGLIKNCKFSKALKRFGKSNNISRTKDAAKSCESLDSNSISSALSGKRCSKSEDCLDFDLKLETDSISSDINHYYENKRNFIDLSADWCADTSDDNIKDLSIIYAENKIKQAYPQDIMELLLKGKTDLVELKLKQRAAEDDYMPMSPCGRLQPTPTQILINSSNPTSSINTAIEENYMVMKGA